MAKELEGKFAAVTGGASGIGLASTEAMLAAGAHVVLVDRDEAALTALREKHGDAVIPLVIDLLDASSKLCAAKSSSTASALARSRPVPSSPRLSPTGRRRN